MAPSIAQVTGGHGALAVDSRPRPSATSNGSHSMNGHVNGDVAIREEPYGTKKRMRIAMLGAGVSGINFFKFAEEKLENVEIVCYEKNSDIGGTLARRTDTQGVLVTFQVWFINSLGGL